MSTAEKNKKIIFEDDLTMFDPSRRAEAVLDYVLGEEAIKEPEKEMIGVDEARASRPVIDRDTGRNMSRVLFVTSDLSVLEKNSSAQNSYVALAGVFDEIHVLVVMDGNGKEVTERVADNVWLYSARAKYWWQLPFRSRSKAEGELVFNGAVRPDVIVGTDPYLAGWAAYLIAGSFARPVQIQVHEDFTTAAFKDKPRGKWYYRVANYLLRRVNSVRTSTDTLADLVRKRFKKVVDIKTLPHFYNLSGIKNAVPSFDVHEKYKDFVFVMLTFAPLTADSYLHNILTALRSALMNPRVGLLVVGNGPAKALHQEKTRLLGIEKNVVFVPKLEDETSFFKTADLLVEMTTGKDSEERVFKAAAAGLPILAALTEVRGDLFKDGQSAFLCPADDIYCFGQKTNKFLNQSSLRVQFAKTAKEIVDMRVNEDPLNYYRAYRDSIEVIIETVNESPSLEPAEAVTDGIENTTIEQPTVSLASSGVSGEISGKTQILGV